MGLSFLRRDEVSYNYRCLRARPPGLLAVGSSEAPSRHGGGADSYSVRVGEQVPIWLLHPNHVTNEDEPRNRCSDGLPVWEESFKSWENVKHIRLSLY